MFLWTTVVLAELQKRAHATSGEMKFFVEFHASVPSVHTHSPSFVLPALVAFQLPLVTAPGHPFVQQLATLFVAQQRARTLLAPHTCDPIVLDAR